MSKQYLLQLSGLAALTLLLLSPVLTFAQDTPQSEDKDTLPPGRQGKMEKYDEIIIRHKNDKDSKVTIEMKDGQVFINGKPAAEFSDSNISVNRKKVRIMRRDDFSFSGPGEIEEPGDHITIEGAPGSPDMYTPEPYAPLSPFRKHSGTLSVNVGNRAFLGVTSDKSEEEGAGAKVTEIRKGSAAEKAGLKQGDLITKIDDMTIDDPSDLSDAVHKYKPQDKITVTYKREGKEAKATAILGKSEPINKVFNYRYEMPNLNMQEYDFKQLAPPGQYHNFNFNLRDEKPRLGIRAQDTEDGKGVKVLEVGDESAAEKAGIKEGDILTSFDGKEVNSAVTLAELAKAAKDKPSVKVGLIREGKAREIEIRVPKKLKTANL